MTPTVVPAEFVPTFAESIPLQDVGYDHWVFEGTMNGFMPVLVLRDWEHDERKRLLLTGRPPHTVTHIDMHTTHFTVTNQRRAQQWNAAHLEP